MWRKRRRQKEEEGGVALPAEECAVGGVPAALLVEEPGVLRLRVVVTLVVRAAVAPLRVPALLG